MIKSIIVLLITSIAIYSCRNQSVQISENDRGVIIADIRNTIQSYFDDIRKEGLSAEFKYLDSSSGFFWVPPGFQSAISYDSVAKVITNNIPLFQSIDNSIDTLIVRTIDREYAQFTEKINSITTDKVGKVSKIVFWETGLMVKRKTGWKFLCGQTFIIKP